MATKNVEHVLFLVMAQELRLQNVGGAHSEAEGGTETECSPSDMTWGFVKGCRHLGGLWTEGRDANQPSREPSSPQSRCPSVRL